LSKPPLSAPVTLGTATRTRSRTIVFDHPAFDGHEQVIFCHDPVVELNAIIAIHSTVLGPAAGGCRMQPYGSVDEALNDVLRLAQGMSFKNAMADLPLGGGKCVIIADPDDVRKPELLRAFARHVQQLAGRFWTAIDVGVGPAEAEILAENCDYIFANASRYEEGFDPSAYTALGGFTSLKAAAAHVWGSDDLRGRRVAIQGLGATGSRLAAHLHEAGANLVVADVRQPAVDEIVARFDATAVDPSVIHKQPVDIFAPCALGAVINDETLPEIHASIVCGLANNQLAEARHGTEMQQRGITYVPDYVANGGGITAAGSLIYSNPSDDEIRRRVLGLFATVSTVLQRADETGRPPSEIADRMARSRIAHR